MVYHRFLFYNVAAALNAPASARSRPTSSLTTNTFTRSIRALIASVFASRAASALLKSPCAPVSAGIAGADMGAPIAPPVAKPGTPIARKVRAPPNADCWRSLSTTSPRRTVARTLSPLARERMFCLSVTRRPLIPTMPPVAWGCAAMVAVWIAANIPAAIAEGMVKGGPGGTAKARCTANAPLMMD